MKLGRFRLQKTTRLDAKGRFYIPESVVKQIFEGVEDDEREVDVYTDEHGHVLLVPVTE